MQRKHEVLLPINRNYDKIREIDSTRVVIVTEIVGDDIESVNWCSVMLHCLAVELDICIGSSSKFRWVNPLSGSKATQ